jgi:hypothetical protein
MSFLRFTPAGDRMPVSSLLPAGTPCYGPKWHTGGYCFRCSSIRAKDSAASLLMELGKGSISHHLLRGGPRSSQSIRGPDLDWGDVERILIRQHGKLNVDQIRSELKPLLELKNELEALKRLEQKLAIVDRRLRAKP